MSTIAITPARTIVMDRANGSRYTFTHRRAEP